jgi:hypothetical protein
MRSPADTLAQAQDFLVVPRKGLQLPRQLPFERWISIGHRLAIFHTSSAWCLGDWLIYGEEAYAGRYREAIDQTSLEYQTLRNYSWVARRFEQSRRREALSFAHHAEVAALAEPEQDFWLRKAEEFHWSRNQLRREVRGSLNERSETVGTGRSRDQHTSSDGDSKLEHQLAQPGGIEPPWLRIPVSPEQLKNCRAAADRRGLPVEDWAMLTLDSAAQRELDPNSTRTSLAARRARRYQPHPDHQEL